MSDYKWQCPKCRTDNLNIDTRQKDTPTRVVMVTIGVILVLSGLFTFGITAIIGIVILLYSSTAGRETIETRWCDGCDYHMERTL